MDQDPGQTGSRAASQSAAERPSPSDTRRTPHLMRDAYLPINRANLPAQILGGLTFQRQPSDLILDGVQEFHRELFQTHLPVIADRRRRAERFMDYVDVAFRLFRLEEVGWDPAGPKKRTKATYLQLIRGWSVDANGTEAAVLKGWVESRFGLKARYHGGPIHQTDSAAYEAFMAARSRGLFCTNALEGQLDLLYSFCQYELSRDPASDRHLRLYRGVDGLSDHEQVAKFGPRRHVVLLNNLSSFTSERERAEEFGTHIMEARIPRAKVFFHNKLIPKMLSGEDEYVVIGGLYDVSLSIY
jgi:NAD+--dinitrogen-reductase ADP-D-ribosyltransferase